MEIFSDFKQLKRDYEKKYLKEKVSVFTNNVSSFFAKVFQKIAKFPAGKLISFLWRVMLDLLWVFAIILNIVVILFIVWYVGEEIAYQNEFLIKLSGIFEHIIAVFMEFSEAQGWFQ